MRLAAAVNYAVVMYVKAAANVLRLPCGCGSWLELDVKTGQWVPRSAACWRHA